MTALQRSIKTVIAENNKIEREMMKKVNALGVSTLDFVKSYISGNKKRSQAGEPPKLENAMDIEYFPNGWGIGNIDRLNKDAPHWHWIN